MRKGEQTRQAVLDRALAMATERGLEALTIGDLAKELGLSKSGLFAHFESKENLQAAVLETAAERFRATLAPALRAPRGEPRLRAFFERLIEWEKSSFMPGGCVFLNVAHEVDVLPAPVRRVLVERQQELVAALRKAARLAVEEGHLRADLDLDQFAFDFYGIYIGFHYFRHLLKDPAAEPRARSAFQTLIENARP